MIRYTPASPPTDCTADDGTIVVYNQNRETLGQNRVVIKNNDKLDQTYKGLEITANDFTVAPTRLALQGTLLEGAIPVPLYPPFRADRLALSIFVNPLQFGPHEDLARYPRDQDGDLGKAAAAGADVLAVLNASPFHLDKAAEREERMAERAQALGRRGRRAAPRRRAFDRPPWRPRPFRRAP